MKKHIKNKKIIDAEIDTRGMRARDRFILYTIFAACLGFIFLGYNFELNKVFNVARAEVSVPKIDNTSMRDWVIKEIKEAGIDEYKAWAIINCESGWNPETTNVNKNGKGIDRGLWQINDRFYPGVKNSCAYDYKCSTEAAIKIIQKRGFGEWVCAGILRIK